MKDKKGKKKHKGKNGGADHGDAQIVLRLYDFRREAQMREARKFIGEWLPQSIDDVLKVANTFGTVENQYFRQVYSYWEMASSLVHRGALNGDLFDDWSA